MTEPFSSKLLKNAHLRRTSMYVSLFGICPQKARTNNVRWRTPHPSAGSPVSGALHLGVFAQPEQQAFFSNLLGGGSR